MVFGGIFAQADYYRIRNKRGNLWRDNTWMILIYIYLEWD